MRDVASYRLQFRNVTYRFERIIPEDKYAFSKYSPRDSERHGHPNVVGRVRWYMLVQQPQEDARRSKMLEYEKLIEKSPYWEERAQCCPD